MPETSQGVTLLTPEQLQELCRTAISEALTRFQADNAKLDGRIAYFEPEAAEKLSMKPHQLRDQRLLGRVQACVGPGDKIMYTREQLLNYLASRPWTPEKA